MNEGRSPFEMQDRVMHAVESGDEALVMMRFMVELAKMGLCHLRSDFMSLAYMSRETFYETYGVNMYSKSIHPQLRRFYDYRFRTLNEVGIENAMNHHVVFSVMRTMNQETTLQTLRCIAEEIDEKEQQLPFFTLQALRKTLIVCALLLVCAVVNFLLEISCRRTLCRRAR